MRGATTTGGNVIADPDADTTRCGLHRYVQLVAAALGTGLEGSWYGWNTEATAYLPLPVSPCSAGGHGQRFTLLWHERSGWSLGVGTHDEVVVFATYGHDVVPAPRVVAAFVHDVMRGSHEPAVTAADYVRGEVRLRLAAYAPSGPDAPTATLPPRRR
ncbi:DUF6292 family protein [Lentzea flava]|uniref:DUF6292 family protein n=1 Tax=Lentzea flava TaxID=103732 RepID=UPI00166F9041|nr:DUF6292 family protein [Lentzea flava]